ncbi:hypothetical protein AAC387_Pa02g2254 [Persea americana]
MSSHTSEEKHSHSIKGLSPSNFVTALPTELQPPPGFSTISQADLFEPDLFQTYKICQTGGQAGFPGVYASRAVIVPLFVTGSILLMAIAMAYLQFFRHVENLRCFM